MRILTLLFMAAWLCLGCGCWAPRGVLLAAMISDKTLQIGEKPLQVGSFDPMVTTVGPRVTAHSASPLPSNEVLAWYQTTLQQHG